MGSDVPKGAQVAELGSACRSLRVLVMWVCGTLMVQAVFPVEVGGPVMLQAGPLRMEGH